MKAALSPRDLLLVATKRSVSDTKKQVSLKFEHRHLAYLNSMNVSLQKLASISLQQFLEGNGVDLSIPHDNEIWSPADPNDRAGKPVTWGEARRQGLVDAKDRPDTGEVKADRLGGPTL